MPANSAISTTVSWADLPPDLQCAPGDMNQLGPLIAQGLQISSTEGAPSSDPSNSIAQQALETANAALAQANAALAAIPNFRIGSVQAISAGDTTLAVSWSPPMPSTNYFAILAFYGADAAVAVFYASRVVDGSRAVSSCTFRVDNAPTATQVSYLILAPPV